jgi:hypothetical protein
MHQDGNDVFKWCAMAGLHDPAVDGNVEQLHSLDELIHTFRKYREKGMDLHVVIRDDYADEYLAAAAGESLHVAAAWTNEGQRFLVLCQEPYHRRLGT